MGGAFTYILRSEARLELAYHLGPQYMPSKTEYVFYTHQV